MRAERFVISGRVQGVGFRYFVQAAALRLGLSGWVKNLPQGAVECVVSGAPEDMTRLADELRKGPPLSKVAAVHSEAHPAVAGNRFEIRY